MSLSPQARWQAYKATLPTFTRRQWIGILLASGFVVIGFLLVVFPFLIPLGELNSPEGFADSNGHFVEVNDQKIYYIHQSGDRDPVILIHGFHGSSVTWRDSFPEWVGYDLYALDLTGFGLSQKGFDLALSHRDYATLIVDWMAALNIPKAHLVGYDMGGNIAVHVAQRYPEQVQSLTLVSAALIYDPSAQVPSPLVDNAIVQRWGKIFMRWILPASVEINLFSAAYDDSIVDEALIRDYQRTFETHDWDVSLLAMARNNHNNYLPQPLQTLDLPTLVIWGNEDRWITPSVGEKIAEDIPNAEFMVLGNAGHLPVHEVPKVFAVALDEFWQSHTIE